MGEKSGLYAIKPAEIGQKQRILSLDIIKGLSIIMVIITHIAYIPQTVRSAILWPYTILPAVPLFLMASVYAFLMAEDRVNGTILSWFGKHRFYPRLIRFLVPWIFTIVVEIVLLFVLLGASKINFWSIVKIIVEGGRGPGAYYVMIVFQLMVVFPFMKYAFQKAPFSASILFIGTQVAWEILCDYNAISSGAYNILIPRYLSNLVLGFLFYKYRRQLKNTAIPMCALIAGGLYLLNTYYRGYESVLTMEQGNRTMIAALYSFGLFYYLMQLEPVFQRAKRLVYPLSYVGKASYHILLTQMTYYYFARSKEFELLFDTLFVRGIVNIMICVTIGCLFFFLESQLRNLLGRRHKKQVYRAY